MYLLLLLSVVLSVLKSTIYNRFAKKEKPSAVAIFRFNAVCYGTAGGVALCLGLGGSLSASTALCAAAYGMTVFALQSLSVAAMTAGSMAITSLLVLYGMIIPAMAGPIFWGEPFGITQTFGIIVMLFSLWLLREKSIPVPVAGEKRIPLAVGCFILSGTAGLIEKIHQKTEARTEKPTFLVLAFGIMFVLSVLGVLLLRKSKSPSETVQDRMAASGYGAAVGTVACFYSLVNLTLAGGMDSLVYYPIANGGALFLTVLVSAVVFHERMDVRKIIGCAAGLTSIILLSLPAL